MPRGMIGENFLNLLFAASTRDAATGRCHHATAVSQPRWTSCRFESGSTMDARTPRCASHWRPQVGWDADICIF